MNHKEAFILIVICACIVFFERSLPWIVFGKKEMPKIVKRLSDLLPASLMVILVVYSLRSLTTSDFHDSFALISASIFTAVFHYYQKNQILSVISGTAVYISLLTAF